MRRPRTAAGELRYRIRADQAEFGKLLGKSLGLIRQIEAGVPPSPGVQRRLVELATEYGYGDLVDDFLADREEPRRMEDLPRQIFQPRHIAEASADRRLAAIEATLAEIQGRLATLERSRGRDPKV